MVSCFDEKADAVYHTIVLGLRNHYRMIMDRLAEDWVKKTLQYARASSNELGHMIEFTRFSELEGGILC